MQSERQHIDDFFREKEAAFTPGSHLQEAHWQQMNEWLANPHAIPAKPRVKVFTSRRIIKFLGGLGIVTIITVVLITASKHKKANKTLPQVTIHKTAPQPASNIIIAAKKLPATKPLVKNKSVTVIAEHKQRPVQNVHVASSAKKTTILPMHRTSAVADTARFIPEAKPDAATMLSLFYKELEQQPQVFTIESCCDTVLVAKEGTRLSIPANAFINNNGNVVTGNVKISIKEYYRYDAMIAAHLHTTSNGRQLVTGGMVHIDAVSNNDELQIQTGKQIGLTMPTASYDNRMQLFTGSIRADHSGNPELPPHGTVDTINTGQPNDINWVLANPFTIPDRIATDTTARPFELRNKETAAFYIYSTYKVDVKTLKKEMREKLGYSKIRIKRLSSRDKKQELIRNNSYDQITRANPSKGIDTLWVIEKYSRKMYSPKTIPVTVSKEGRLPDAFFENTPGRKEYFFPLNRLGWINCDRFINDTTPKINFTVNPGKDYDNRYFLSQLLFTKYQSLLPGYYTGSKLVFNNIPQSEPVQLISVGIKDGKVVACVQPFNISKQEVSDLTYEEVTPEQFRKKLQVIIPALKQ